MNKLSDEKIKEILIPIFIKQDQASIHWPDIFEEVRAIEAAVLEAQKQEPDFFVVVDETGAPEYTALWPEFCHEHINNAINEYEIEGASKWKVRSLYAAPVVPPQQEPVGKPHRWNDDGERCLDCGDKDWMADKYCSAAPVVQPGMVMVPREPTIEMREALKIGTRVSFLETRSIYRRLIAAAEGNESK